MAVTTRKAHFRNDASGRRVRVEAHTVQTRQATPEMPAGSIDRLRAQAESGAAVLDPVSLSERAALVEHPHWAPVSGDNVTGCDVQVITTGTAEVRTGDGYHEPVDYDIYELDVYLSTGRCVDTRFENDGTTTYMIETEQDGTVAWNPDRVDPDRLNQNLKWDVGDMEYGPVTVHAALHPDDAAARWQDTLGHVPSDRFLEYTPDRDDPDLWDSRRWADFDGRRAARVQGRSR